MTPYEVYQSDVIIKHQSKLISQLLEFHEGTDYRTENFYAYNIFTEVTSTEMYDLFCDVKAIIKKQLPSGRLWMQAWLNVHKQDECLDWHHHNFPWHGYISIDPKDTTTEFSHWSVENKVGNIYFGPGTRANEHRVVVNSPYNDYRITMGFDVQTTPTSGLNKFIPI